MYKNISPGYLLSLIPQQVDAISGYNLRNSNDLQIIRAKTSHNYNTATMEQSIYRNKTTKLFERGQTYCAQILLLWGKKSPDTSHTPMYGLQFTKFGPLYEEYHGLTYVPVW